MGRKPRSDTIRRQWEILKLLPAKGAGRSVADLQAALADLGHDVDKRTVQRDLQILSSLFRLECNDKSVPYGWRWAAGAHGSLPAPPDPLVMALVARPAREAPDDLPLAIPAAPRVVRDAPSASDHDVYGRDAGRSFCFDDDRTEISPWASVTPQACSTNWTSMTMP